MNGAAEEPLLCQQGWDALIHLFREATWPQCKACKQILLWSCNQHHNAQLDATFLHMEQILLLF